MTNIARLRHFVAEMTRLVSSSVPPVHAPRSMRHASCSPISSRMTIGYRTQWLGFHRTATRKTFCGATHLSASVSSACLVAGCPVPIHDHQVWGLVGMLRGSETSQRFISDPQTGRLAKGDRAVLSPGDVEILLPSEGDTHQVANALTERASISIHVYGGNMGAVRRHTFEADTGRPDLFVSGYTNRDTPNLWDRSVEARAIG